jgi:hypothetical protein
VATPAPVSLVTVPVANGPWLDRLNLWRASTGLSALTENPTWSAGDYNHAVYMVKTGLVTHYETVGNPYYTPEGDLAAQNSNIQVSSSTGTSDTQAIDWWMGAPFHAMGMMDPRLTQTGFGSYRDASASPWQEGGALDTLRGNSFSGGQYPVFFPGNGATEPLASYSGNEFPDPLQACPGYTNPTGLPVFVEVGGNVATTAGPVHSFTGNGVALQHCVIDSNSPSVGSSLTGRGGVIVIPRQPLQSGVNYVVALTVNGVPYTWSFTVGPLVSPPIVTGVTPNVGPSAGGTTVTITGTGFSSAMTGVKFGGTSAASFAVVNDTTATAVSPAHAVSTVDVMVTTSKGTSAVSPSDQFTYTGLAWYFQWFDMATPGMVGDNIHLLNVGGSTANISVTLPGAMAVNVSLPAGAETHVSFGAGHIGGPVIVNSDQQVLASQRVQYFQSFNEVWAMTVAQAATTSYIQWFDTATPGMGGDNIHVLNPGATSANVTVSLGSATPLSFSLGAGAETHVTFPVGTIGGPVKITSSLPVLASSRVQYFQTFNEVVARSAAQATNQSIFQWFDTVTPGMVGDNIHVLNPGVTVANVSVSLGGNSRIFSVAPGAESYVTFLAPTIGGPVTVASDQPVLSSQRVQYFQSFNETASESQAQGSLSTRFMWFDLASPGMVADNVHILNVGGSTAHLTVSLPGANSIVLTLAVGAETYVTFPAGHLGGPVTITSDQLVLAAQRVQYFQTFNEVPSM